MGLLSAEKKFTERPEPSTAITTSAMATTVVASNPKSGRNRDVDIGVGVLDFVARQDADDVAVVP